MHYDNRVFSKNGDNTLQSISDPNRPLGNMDDFSAIDIKQLLKDYPCKAWDKKPAVYVDTKKETSEKRKCTNKNYIQVAGLPSVTAALFNNTRSPKFNSQLRFAMSSKKIHKKISEGRISNTRNIDQKKRKLNSSIFSVLDIPRDKPSVYVMKITCHINLALESPFLLFQQHDSLSQVPR